ncbi:MAG TPA: hypothetical protein VKI18_17005, partial [Albitalea sp.]|nr:hypothetical protein [Albitalea sp.]
MATDPRTLSELRQALRDGTVTVRSLVLRLIGEQARSAPQAWIAKRSSDDLLTEADACDARLREMGPA